MLSQPPSALRARSADLSHLGGWGWDLCLSLISVPVPHPGLLLRPVWLHGEGPTRGSVARGKAAKSHSD